MVKFKSVIPVILLIGLVGCSGSSNSLKGKKIDCEIEEYEYEGISLIRTFVAFTDDDASSGFRDGEVTVTIKSNISKGEFILNDEAMVPYIKSGNVFTPKYPVHWDTTELPENVDTSGDVLKDCSVSMVVPK
jgi:hypothetical protein